MLLDFCNHTFENLTPPSAWLTGGIIPVPKKGDLTLASNYRGITLMPIAAKNYKLIFLLIAPVLDPLLRKNQNGFRKGRLSGVSWRKCVSLTKMPLFALLTSKKLLISSLVKNSEIVRYS